MQPTTVTDSWQRLTSCTCYISRSRSSFTTRSAVSPRIVRQRLLTLARRVRHEPAVAQEHVNASVSQLSNAAADPAYITAPDHIRRQVNRGFFRKLFNGEDGEGERAELTEPFVALLDASNAFQNRTSAPDEHAKASQITPDVPNANHDRTRPSSVFAATYGNQETVTESKDNNTNRTLTCTMCGLKKSCVVGRVGLEPTAKGL
jgi:hypothetical protein